MHRMTFWMKEMKTMFRRMKAQRGTPFRTVSLREVVSLKGSLRGNSMGG